MKVTYFSDTDTALLEFSSARVVATHELARDVLVDLDAHGRPVSITIEHARRVNLRRVRGEGGKSGLRPTRVQAKVLSRSGGRV